VANRCESEGDDTGKALLPRQAADRRTWNLLPVAFA
jgi:hypothetical protein